MGEVNQTGSARAVWARSTWLALLRISVVLGVGVLVPQSLSAETPTMRTIPHLKPRVIVLPDLSHEPDDE